MYPVYVHSTHTLTLYKSDPRAFRTSIDSERRKETRKCHPLSELTGRHFSRRLATTALPCHFLRLLPHLPYEGGRDGACAVKVFLVASVVFAAHYLIAAALLIGPGVLRGSSASFVPWLVVQAALVPTLALVTCLEAANTVPSDGPPPMAALAALATLAAAFAWLAGLYACLEARAVAKANEDRRGFDYFRF